MTRRFYGSYFFFFGGGRSSENCRFPLWKLPHAYLFGIFKALAFLELLGVAYLNVQRIFWRT